MTDTAIHENRLFAKPRCAAFDCSRPSGVLPARFLPSIALPSRVSSARRVAFRIGMDPAIYAPKSNPARPAPN